MTNEDIIRSARDIATQCCNRMPSWQHDYAMQRIMELIDASATAEREACAKIFDDRDNGIGFYEPHEPAEMIRARGNK